MVRVRRRVTRMRATCFKARRKTIVSWRERNQVYSFHHRVK